MHKPGKDVRDRMALRGENTVRMRLGPIISMMVVGLLLSLPHTGQALPFTFTKIADTNTSIPGGTGNFTLFGAPSLETGTVTFTDFGPSGQTGFYSSPIGGPLQAQGNRI